MRQLLLFCLLVVLVQPGYGALCSSEMAVYQPAEKSVSQRPVADHVDRKTLEKQLGRKLKFSERLAAGMINRKARRLARQYERGQRPVDGVAVASLGAGLSALLLMVALASPVSLLFASLAIVLGIVGLVRFRNNPQFRRGKGFAIAGLVIGSFFILTLLTVLAILAAGGL